MVCREKSSNVKKCRVFEIFDGLSNGGVWSCLGLGGGVWNCLGLGGGVRRCFGLGGGVWGVWAGRNPFWLVPIGDFDIFRALATRRDMSRNVEKCRKMSSFVEVSTEGDLPKSGTWVRSVCGVMLGQVIKMTILLCDIISISKSTVIRKLLSPMKI